jgi:uncharacterized protein YjiS (DUF1127 family)
LIDLIMNIRLLHPSRTGIRTAPACREGNQTGKETTMMTRYQSGAKAWILGPYDLSEMGRAVRALTKNVAQRLKNRRAVNQLLDWDDHALKDIGLTHADVRLSLALPLKEDPSSRLCDWAHERRASRLMRQRDYDGPIAGPQLRLVSGVKRRTSSSSSR